MWNCSVAAEACDGLLAVAKHVGLAFNVCLHLVVGRAVFMEGCSDARFLLGPPDGALRAAPDQTHDFRKTLVEAKVAVAGIGFEIESLLHPKVQHFGFGNSGDGQRQVKMPHLGNSTRFVCANADHHVELTPAPVILDEGRNRLDLQVAGTEARDRVGQVLPLADQCLEWLSVLAATVPGQVGAIAHSVVGVFDPLDVHTPHVGDLIDEIQRSAVFLSGVSEHHAGVPGQFSAVAVQHPVKHVRTGPSPAEADAGWAIDDEWVSHEVSTHKSDF